MYITQFWHEKLLSFDRILFSSKNKEKKKKIDYTFFLSRENDDWLLSEWVNRQVKKKTQQISYSVQIFCHYSAVKGLKVILGLNTQ